MQMIGHQKQWQFLKESFLLGRIPHAFLFEGEEKLGKKTLAIEFIKFINCLAPYRNEVGYGAGPCQKCLSCQAIERRIHPDFIFIEPIDNEIQVSQIRDLSLKLSEKPSISSFKTAILDKVHLMNQEAQSAFLKTLEEPKGNTILILITEYPERLFSTILSRVQKIKFYPVRKKEIENFLKERKIPKEEIEEMIKFSLGKPGLIYDFLKNPEKLREKKEKIRELIKILNSPIPFRFQYAKELASQNNLSEVLTTWLDYFRNVLLSNLRGEEKEGKYSLLRLKNILWQIQRINFLISTTNVNQRLALEILLLEL
jgi:DNA polymerase-3 subunit delta'